VKIYSAQSSRFHASQIQRIEDGFRLLGHEVTDFVSDAQIVYQNNPWFDQVLVDKAAGRLASGAKIIFNVQDIPFHIPSYPTDRLKQQLQQADAVTAISTTTASDLETLTGISAPVIYQPIMPIVRTGHRKYPYRVLFIGRVGDPNKRSSIAAHALSILGFTSDQIITVGMEAPFYGGAYWGVANHETLNDIYNSVDFVVCTARFGGIELPVIEAMAAGAVPLVLRDLHTREELLPASLFPEYTAVEPSPQSLTRFIASLVNEDSGQRLDAFKERLYQHYLSNWRYKTSSIGVAGRILKVYDSLVIDRQNTIT